MKIFYRMSVFFFSSVFAAQMSGPGKNFDQKLILVNASKVKDGFKI